MDDATQQKITRGMRRHKHRSRLFFVLSLLVYGLFILAGPELGP